ncbi:unnamed protein product [Polarella glacialis]|uniref:Uncharacterized protein n=1 Tax=Polarella glacialis TaxID=89957 RepID=A0A813LCV3_POLGL|nr:unnamed protein product [Polarella glacialis]
MGHEEPPAQAVEPKCSPGEVKAAAGKLVRYNVIGNSSEEAGVDEDARTVQSVEAHLDAQNVETEDANGSGWGQFNELGYLVAAFSLLLVLVLLWSLLLWWLWWWWWS